MFSFINRHRSSASSSDAGWLKNGFFVGARKLNLKFPVKTFTCFCYLTTTRQPAPSSLNTYSYLPFKNSKFVVVRECNKEY